MPWYNYQIFVPNVYPIPYSFAFYKETNLFPYQQKKNTIYYEKRLLFNEHVGFSDKFNFRPIKSMGGILLFNLFLI